jgi:pre-mRNA-splicing factor SPF27
MPVVGCRSIDQLNRERKLQQQAAGAELRVLEDQYYSALRKNLEISAACQSIEEEMELLQAKIGRIEKQQQQQQQQQGQQDGQNKGEQQQEQDVQQDGEQQQNDGHKEGQQQQQEQQGKEGGSGEAAAAEQPVANGVAADAEQQGGEQQPGVDEGPADMEQ